MKGVYVNALLPLTFNVESALLRNSKDVCTDVGARGDKIHGVLIIFIPNQIIIRRFF